jgi:two-component system nitrogen regulation sensor histidine kinase GlnL
VSKQLSPFTGLDLLATAVVALDDAFVVCYANPAAENLFATAAKSLIGHPFLALFSERAELEHALAEARVTHWDYSAQNVTYLRAGREPLPLSCIVTRIDTASAAGAPPVLLAELRPIEQQLRQAREERLVSEQQSNRELIRNLAHEIKNPLGGLRGSAQLLERELGQLRLPGARSGELREYTQVIIKEADRLQGLMDRMLTPHRAPRVEPLAIHEVLEHVRSLLTAEFSIEIKRDYDPSLPEILGDREQLIQAVLNIGRNAVQSGGKEISFRTRSARQITIMRQRHKLALELQVVDDGPGVPEEIQDRIFNPLVSGREGGTGLGLSLAQTYVQYHRGVIEFESRPGRTLFRILLPLT